MKLPTLILMIVLAAVAAFAALNWSVFLVPTELSLGVTTAHLPLGLLMLGLLAFLAALFLVMVVYLQGSALLETRRHTKELRTNRELADQAEASRFTELRVFLEAQLAKQATRDAESRAIVLARVDRLESDLRAAIEQSGNTLAAYIGELEDRLEQESRNPPVGR